jgi:hypothetical protein
MDRSKELTGIGTIDAVLSGNERARRERRLTTGNGLRYGDYGALAYR